MNCEETRRQLSDLMDAPGKDMPDEVREHLEGCSECCSCLEEYEQLDRELTTLPAVSVPETVHRSLRAMLDSRGERRGIIRKLIPSFRLGPPRLAFAASLAVVLISLLVLQPWKDVRSVYRVAETELVKPGYDHVAWKMGINRFVDDVTARSGEYARQEIDREFNLMSARTATGLYRSVGNIDTAIEERR